jgi:hypothetical protein
MKKDYTTKKDYVFPTILWYFPKNDKRVSSVSWMVGYELEAHVLTPVVSGTFFCYHAETTVIPI